MKSVKDVQKNYEERLKRKRRKTTKAMQFRFSIPTSEERIKNGRI